MNETIDALIPSDKEISEMKQQLEQKQRQAEFKNLHKQINKVEQTMLEANEEFDGAMQSFDSSKLLTQKRENLNFIELIMQRIKKMMSPRPVINNIIAICVALIALFFLQHEVSIHHFGQYRHYIGAGLLVLAAQQVLKSSTGSLIMPVIAVFSGMVIAHSLHGGETFLGYHAQFYQFVMLTGVLGLGASVLSIS